MNKDLFSLEGKHILITGGSSGIGRECAIVCSQLGANVTISGRDEKRLSETASLCPCETHVVVSEVLDTETLEKELKAAVVKFGKLDGVVNVAGIEKTLPLKLHKKEVLREIIDINLIGSIEVSRIASSKKLFSSLGGSIVFVSSIMGVVGNAGLVGYSSSKGALITAAKSLGIELAARKIRVNCISPGHIRGTKMSEGKEENLSEAAIESIIAAHPLGLGTTEDVAYAIVFLLCNASKWITGTNIIVDGGYCAK